MTRETKIGLLVGLAFIIVIGILLSDYNRNEIQGAPLPQVVDNVRSSTATMHNDSNQSVAVPPPAPTVPVRPVPTSQDLHQGTMVDITPAPGTPTLSAQSDQHSTPPVVSNTPGAASPAHVPTEPVGPTGIEGTEWVGAHSPVTGERPVTPAAPTAPAAPTVNGAKAYVAIAGDTVSKLAGRFMGGNTKTNREAIMAINPSLKANPNNVIVGRTYMIPPASKPVVAAAPTTPAAHPAPVTPAPVATATTDGPHYYYTVKENDNLWKIASEQLGDGTAWAAIKELNKDVLKGGENLRPNMRLRLPAKPVASTN